MKNFRHIVSLLFFVLTLFGSPPSFAQGPGMSKDTALPIVHGDQWSRCCRFSTVDVDPERIEFLKPYAGPATARIRKILKLRGIGEPVDIVVTRDLNGFKEAMPRIGRRGRDLQLGDWVAGIAFSHDRLVIIRLGHFPAREIRSTLIHELAHVYVSEAASYARIPRWFNEATAMILSDENTIQHLESVLTTKSANAMPELEDLEWGFTAHGGTVSQSYAASFAFLRWAVETRGGMHLIADVLHRLGENQEFNVAFQSVFGSSVSELQKEWESKTQTNRWFPLFFRFGDIVWFSMVVIFVWGVVVTLRKRKKSLARMEVRESFIYDEDLTWDTVDAAMGKSWWERRKARKKRARQAAVRSSLRVIDGARSEDETDDEEPLIH